VLVHPDTLNPRAFRRLGVDSPRVFCILTRTRFAEDAMDRPNILFIQTDQQMARSLGCYGSTICRTPTIDALARDGVRFDNAYCATPICSPARASIQTGLLPSHHGIQTNVYTRGCLVHELPDHPTLLSRRLQSLGYSIGFTGKWHMGFGDDKQNHPEYQAHVRATPVLGRLDLAGSLPSTIGYEGDDFPGHGGIGMDTPQYREYLKSNGIELRTRKVFDRYPDTFEVLSGPQSTVTHFLTNNAIRHVGSFLQRGRPFFYFLNFWGPHSPYHAPSEFVDLYRDVPIPPWKSYDEDQRHKPGIHDAHRTETTAHWTWEHYQTALRYYYASNTEIDANVARLIDFLKQSGQYDNTLILFASDHGDSLGIHRGLTDKSFFMYEETCRIPLIIKEPGRPARAGGSDDRFVGTCDLYSTILDYAGLDRADTELDGRSLRPLLDGSATAWRDSIVTESVGLDFLLYTQRMIRFEHYKYVFNAGEIDELYDLRADPDEIRNLAADPAHADLLQRGRLKLDAWMAEHNDGLRERYRRLRLRNRF
jgi:arylsulfatase A-like enzyme